MDKQRRMMVKVDGKNNVEVDLTKALDLRPKVDGTYSLIHDSKNYDVSLEQVDLDKKEVVLILDGKRHVCQISTELDLLIKDMGLLSAKSAKVKEIKAPMPGKVIEVLVKESEEVKKGESLLILEAMKMENVIKAPHDLSIKSIKVELGQAVEKGAVLIKL